jgi:DNA repair and recombination protein RAD54 and RAD54-like protein
MGRIYRQGQTKPCIIYRLFTAGTIEEVILQRQILKQGLSKLTVDLPDGSEAKFTKEELAECFDLKDSSICDTKDKLGTNWLPYDQCSIKSLVASDVPLHKVATDIPESLCFVWSPSPLLTRICRSIL